MKESTDARVRGFHSRRFCLRPGDEPEHARASGDSGFVAHLSACTHGATGWDWAFRLVRTGPGWGFVGDGRLTLFIDEPGHYVPADAKVGDSVAVRLPRARENLWPHRFTLHGGQGGPSAAHPFAKIFVPVKFEAAPLLVEAFSGRLADQLHFGLYVSNAPGDFERSDSALVDVSLKDELGVVRVLDSFLSAHPDALSSPGLPSGALYGPLGLARVETSGGRGDLCDGFGWRISQEAIAGGSLPG